MAVPAKSFLQWAGLCCDTPFYWISALFSCLLGGRLFSVECSEIFEIDFGGDRNPEWSGWRKRGFSRVGRGMGAAVRVPSIWETISTTLYSMSVLFSPSSASRGWYPQALEFLVVHSQMWSTYRYYHILQVAINVCSTLYTCNPCFLTEWLYECFQAFSSP